MIRSEAETKKAKLTLTPYGRNDGDLTDLGINAFNKVANSAFESAGLTYGNFRLTVKVVLSKYFADEDSADEDIYTEYTVSRVSDFIIYTN